MLNKIIRLIKKIIKEIIKFIKQLIGKFNKLDYRIKMVVGGVIAYMCVNAKEGFKNIAVPQKYIDAKMKMVSKPSKEFDNIETDAERMNEKQKSFMIKNITMMLGMFERDLESFKIKEMQIQKGRKMVMGQLTEEQANKLIPPYEKKISDAKRKLAILKGEEPEVEEPEVEEKPVIKKPALFGKPVSIQKPEMPEEQPDVEEEKDEPDSIFTKLAGKVGIKTPQATKKIRKMKGKADKFKKYKKENPGLKRKQLFKLAKADGFKLYA